MIISLSNPSYHIHNQNNTSPPYFRVCDVTNVMEIVFLITYIPLIQIMYARVIRPLEQHAPLACVIYSKGQLRQTKKMHEKGMIFRISYLINLFEICKE